MSFKATLAAFSMALGAQRSQQAMTQMAGASNTGPGADMAQQMQALADQMGLGQGAQQMRAAFAAMGQHMQPAPGMPDVTAALASMGTAASAGMQTMAQMFDTMVQGTPMAEASEDSAKLMIRAMAQAANAMAPLPAQAQAEVLAQLEGATEAERAFVASALQEAPDPAALAVATGQQWGAQVYGAALMAWPNDAGASAPYLAALAQALQLDGATVSALHSAAGRAAP